MAPKGIFARSAHSSPNWFEQHQGDGGRVVGWPLRTDYTPQPWKTQRLAILICSVTKAYFLYVYVCLYIFYIFICRDIKHSRVCSGACAAGHICCWKKILGTLQKLPLNSSRTKHVSFTIENMNSHSHRFCPRSWGLISPEPRTLGEGLGVPFSDPGLVKPSQPRAVAPYLTLFKHLRVAAADFKSFIFNFLVCEDGKKPLRINFCHCIQKVYFFSENSTYSEAISNVFHFDN